MLKTYLITFLPVKILSKTSVTQNEKLKKGKKNIKTLQKTS